MTRTPRRAGARGFTLIEMLVVIIIVGILVTLVVAVGARVTTTSRANTTRDVIRALDTSLSNYIADSGEDRPTASVAYEENTSVGNRNFPIIDGVVPTTNGATVVNSVGLFMLQAKDYSSAYGVAEGLGSEFVRLYTPASGGGQVGVGDEQPELLTVFDAWGQPIRYVHPNFDGEIVDEPRPDCQKGSPVRMRGSSPANNGYFFGENPAFYQELAFMRVRRNYITERERDPAVCSTFQALIPGDGDGGECVSGRPYFYSMGPDADPSDREDNVYTGEPRFIKPGE